MMSLIKELQIADFRIRLQSEMPVFLDEGYEPFEMTSVGAYPDIVLSCLSYLPAKHFDTDRMVFEASDRGKVLYQIFKSNDGLVFFLFDQQREGDIQQVFVLDSDCSRGTVYTHPESDGRFHVLKYPLGPILMYYLTARNNAVLIHASGVFDGHEGRLFTGFSGYGKSTMANLWKSAGNWIINDDRLIVRRKGEEYFMYNTPMHYPDEPKSAALHAVHLIHHAPVNTLERVVGAKAVSSVMAFCIQNNYDASLIGNNAVFLTGMIERIPVYRTGFVPDGSVVTYICDHGG